MRWPFSKKKKSEKISEAEAIEKVLDESYEYEAEAIEEEGIDTIVPVKHQESAYESVSDPSRNSLKTTDVSDQEVVTSSEEVDAPPLPERKYKLGPDGFARNPEDIHASPMAVLEEAKSSPQLPPKVKGMKGYEGDGIC